MVSAIFLLVVIAALGVFAVTLSTTQHQSEAIDIMGKRAYQAARAGIEWGAFQVIKSSVSGQPVAGGCVAAVSNSPVNLDPSLVEFSPVSVSWTVVSAVDGTAVCVYSVNATASNAATAGPVGSQNYVERQVNVTIAP